MVLMCDAGPHLLHGRHATANDALAGAAELYKLVLRECGMFVGEVWGGGVGERRYVGEECILVHRLTENDGLGDPVAWHV